MQNIDNATAGVAQVRHPLVPPLLFLDFDDVIALNTVAGGYDACLAMGQVERGAALEDFANLWQVLFEHRACAHLRAIDTEFRPVYVLSTSWTRFFDQSAMTTVLRQCGLGFVADNLHPDAWETPKNGGARLRAEEISQWLVTQRGSDATVQVPWVILDDTYSGSGLADWSNPAEAGYIVLCQQGVGLTELEYQQLRHAMVNRRHTARPPDEADLATDPVISRES